MSKFEKEPSWAERLPNYSMVEIHPIPFQVVINKYGLNKDIVGELAHIHYRLYDDSPFCIDILDVFKLEPGDEGNVYNPESDLWLTNLGIDATDIPAFVKYYHEAKHYYEPTVTV
jgi:hypothetical protein